mgnify:CR=1 FL=1
MVRRGRSYLAESSMAMRGHAVLTKASTLYAISDMGVTSSRMTLYADFPWPRSIETMRSASADRFWPAFEHCITRKDSAEDALWMAANLLLSILSLASDMSRTSPLTGFRTSTGFRIPKAAARGWKSPSPMKRNASTSPSTDSAAVQLHPRTWPGWHMRLSPFPTKAFLPEASSIALTAGIRPRYCTVARTPTRSGSDESPSIADGSTAASERDSTYRTLGSSPMDGIGEWPKWMSASAVPL